jgi:hypothetical protein
MRIRATPKEVFLGIESKTDGIHQFSIGVLADHICPGDGVVLYTPNDDYSQCIVFAVAEVVDVNSKEDSCSLDVRNYSNLIHPDSRARNKWRKNPYLCPDKEKVLKYGLVDFFVEAFNDCTWAERPIHDLSGRFAKFDLSKRTLLPACGFVYLLRSSDEYKIGRSIDTAKRKKRIEKDKKMDLELIYEFPSNDYERAEATLHLEFAHCRRGRTEFFDLSVAEVDQILNISQMDFPLP